MRFPETRMAASYLAIVLCVAAACRIDDDRKKPGPPPPPDPDAYEANDTPSTCSPIVLTPPATPGDPYEFSAADLSVHDPADEDYFCLVLTAPSAVEVELSFSPTAGNLDLELLDDGGTVIAGSYGPSAAESLTENLLKGTYVIHVFGPAGDTNRYAMVVRARQALQYAPDVFEYNDDSIACTPLSVLAPIVIPILTIHPAVDTDYFCITLPDRGSDWTVTIDIVFIHQDGNLDLDLLDDSLAVIAYSHGFTDNEYISVDVPAGVYYIHVCSADLRPNVYTLRVDAT